MSNYFIPPRVLFAAVAAGYRLWPARNGRGWMVVMQDGREFCTILQGCPTEKAVELFN